MPRKRLARGRRMDRILDALAKEDAFASVKWLLIEPVRLGGDRLYVISILCELADRPGLRYIGGIERDPHRAGERAFKCLAALPAPLQTEWAERIQEWSLEQPISNRSLSLWMAQ